MFGAKATGAVPHWKVMPRAERKFGFRHRVQGSPDRCGVDGVGGAGESAHEPECGSEADRVGFDRIEVGVRLDDRVHQRDVRVARVVGLRPLAEQVVEGADRIEKASAGLPITIGPEKPN